MLDLKKKVKIILKENEFGDRKINKIVKNINKLPLDLFIKYKGKKYILDIVGENPHNANIKLMSTKKFKRYYGGFSIPESDWI